MPTAVSTHHANFSEAMRGDDNCHLRIRKNYKPPMRRKAQHQLWPQAEVGRGKRRYIHRGRT